VLTRHLHADRSFCDETGVDNTLRALLRGRAAVLVPISSVNFAVPSDDFGPNRIPCFDSFNGQPSGILALDDEAKNEDVKLQEQLRTGNNHISPHLRRDLSASGSLFADEVAQPPNSVPSLQRSATMASSFEVPFGDSQEPESRWFSLDTFNSFVANFFGGGTEVDEVTAIDRVAIPDTGNPQPPDNERHSVVLIGGYTHETEKTWYLMLNSWKNLPLFLASAQCLVEAEANAATIRNRMNDIPAGFQRHNRRYTECSSPPAIVHGRWEFKSSLSASDTKKDDGFVCR